MSTTMGAEGPSGVNTWHRGVGSSGVVKGPREPKGNMDVVEMGCPNMF